MSLVIRPAVPEDDIPGIAIHNHIHADRPPLAVEEYRLWLEMDQPAFRYTADLDGIIVGSLDLLKDFHSLDPSHCMAFLQVHPGFWGRGIGQRLYEQLDRLTREQPITRIFTDVREDLPAARRFAERRGFRPTGIADRFSRLDVSAANFEGYIGLEERFLTEGIRITSLADLEPGEAFLRALHRFDEAAARDMPGHADRPPIPFEQYRRRLIIPGRPPEQIWVALDGDQPVGVAKVTRRSENAAMNGFTGVDRAYRGRGIARALKYRTVQWARGAGVTYLYTGNEKSNARMLAINASLGYQPIPGDVEVARTYP